MSPTVPKNLSEWIQQTEKQLTMKRCAYWASLRGLPPSSNKKTVTVEILRKQKFTVDTLNAIMSRIASEEFL